MAHPFDVEEVKNGEDLIDYINTAALRLHAGEIEGSVKWDGINTSFKLITTEDGKKEFRMDRGTSDISSIIGLDADMAFEKWGATHGMPQAIKTLLTIFNTALPEIEPELKILGLWDDPTKYFNTEYIRSAGEGKSNVQEYDKNILAIHGINQFYEKKAQPWRIRAGTSMDRPGQPRPIGADGKPIKAGGIEIPYNHKALQGIIEKVRPIAAIHRFEVYGDVPVEFDPEMEFFDLEETLETPVSIRFSPNNMQTGTLRQWLQRVEHPQERKVTISANEKKNRKRKVANALSKDVYLAVLNSAQEHGESLSEYLEDPNDIKDAINGGIFYHATRVLGQAVKNVLTSEAGALSTHEGVVLRGLEDFLVKLTGDFIVQGLASTHGDPPSVTEGLFQNFTIKVSKDREITKTLNNWLREIKEAKHNYQKPPTLVYNDILSGIPIIDIVQQDFAQEMIYNTVLRYSAGIIVEQEEELVDNEDADPVGPGVGGRTIAIIPGAFKPPHAGHADMIRRYATGDGVPKADQVYVVISAPLEKQRQLRDGTSINEKHALDIWEQVFPDIVDLPNVQFEVAPSEMRSPVTIAYEYIGERSPLGLQRGDSVILGASRKDDDWKRWKDAPKYVHKDEYGEPLIDLLYGKEFAVPAHGRADGEKFSATDMRELISDLVEDPTNQKARTQLGEYIPKDKIDTLLKILGLPQEDSSALEEMSSMGGGMVQGFSGPFPGKRDKKKKKKSKAKKENIDLSMVDEVIRLVMERGILR
jgi:hypothetical protein